MARVFCLQLFLGLLLPASGTTNTTQVKLYFGAGCFWHIQHSFIEAERAILNRDDASLTAIAGYAGATVWGNFCYMDDKVTAEVVGLEIPKESVSQFALTYFNMFVGIDRSHRNDRGPHYRAVIGLPDGLRSSFMTDFNLAQDTREKEGKVRFELAEGHGDDADTLGRSLIWVYDSNRFPFQQAEIYHQFHDDYMPGGDYPLSYEMLRASMACSGRLMPTGCRNDDVTVLSHMDCEHGGKLNTDTAASGAHGGSGDLGTPRAVTNACVLLGPHALLLSVLLGVGGVALP